MVLIALCCRGILSLFENSVLSKRIVRISNSARMRMPHLFSDILSYPHHPNHSTPFIVIRLMTHTAAYLASLATFILRASTETLAVVFDDEVLLTDEFFDSWVPSTSQYSPRGTTIRLCQCIIGLVKQPKIVAGKTVYASSSTVAYALCLLVRFRSLGHQFPVDVDELIALSVFIAYKFLIDWGEGQRSHWAVSLEMSGRRMDVVERSFLDALHYNAWIKNAEFHRVVGRMDLLWEETLEEQAMKLRPTPPDYVLKIFGKR